MNLPWKISRLLAAALLLLVCSACGGGDATSTDAVATTDATPADVTVADSVPAETTAGDDANASAVLKDAGADSVVADSSGNDVALGDAVAPDSTTEDATADLGEDAQTTVTFSNTISPMLKDLGCQSCHSGGKGGFNFAWTNLDNDYNGALAKINLNTPTSSKEKLKLSQPIFAGLLAVSPKTVRAWEQGKNTPSPIASRFLQVLDQHPDLADEHLTPKTIS